PAVCDQLHFPLQSGSNRILAAMHRGSTVEKYLDRLAMARNTIEGLAVSTDIIVGFPGETDDDFQATLDVVSEARFDHAFMFIFSPRPGTAAAAMDNDFVDPAVVQERFQRLMEVQSVNGLASNRADVGRTMEVLAEGPSKKDPSVATTRTRTGKVVHLPGCYEPGTFIDATITEATQHYLVGSPV
ncbi:MAG: radical SAM protein, partial [Acidimicrobiia bacterium]|nr:radical SAM protein [Acidimicrobiia bacterium]